MVDLSTRFVMAARHSAIRDVLERGISVLAATCAGLFGAAAQARAQAPVAPASDPIGQWIRNHENQKPHALDSGNTKPLMKMKNGDWQYGEHKIKGTIFDLIKAVSTENHFPLRLMLDIIARESGFNPNAQNESGACGLIQFMPTTLYEMVYKYGATLKGYEDRHLDQRVTRKKVLRPDGRGHTVGYEAHSPEDEKYLRDACFDPAFNLRLGIKYKLEVAAMLQQWLDGIKGHGNDYYPLKSHELYLGFFAGPNAAEKIIRDIKMGRNTPVTFYFSPSALKNPANRKVLFKDSESKIPYTGIELLNNIAKKMGYDPALNGLDMPSLPDVRRQVFRSPPTPRGIEDFINRPS